MKSLLLSLMIAGALCSPASSAEPTLTPAQVRQGFMEGVVICTFAKAKGVRIADLPPHHKKLVSTGTDSAREQQEVTDPNVPVWDVVSAKGIVSISEPDDRKCHVTAYGPEVRSTLMEAAAVLNGEDFNFKHGQVKNTASGHTIRMVREYKDRTILVTMSGSNLGQWMHLSKFSVMYANVVWISADEMKAASEKPEQKPE